MAWRIDVWDDEYYFNPGDYGIEAEYELRSIAVALAQAASRHEWFHTFVVYTSDEEVSALIYRGVEFIPLETVTKYYGDRFSEKTEDHASS